MKKIKFKFSENPLQLDWLDTHPEITKKNSLPVLPETKSFLDYFWPASMDYFNPLSTVFLMQVHNLSFLSKRKEWFVRDGLIPLLWFFKIHPKPKNLKTKLFIHHELQAFVPQIWRPYFGTYELTTLDPIHSKKPESILICGLMMDSYFSQKNMNKNLQSVVKLNQTVDLKKIDKVAFLPARTGHNWSSDSSFHAEYMIRLCQMFGSNIKTISQNRFMSMDHCEEYYCLELNDKMLCADSYLTHFLLSRGAKLLNAPVTQGRFVPFSLFHGALIQDQLAKMDRKSKEIQKNFHQTAEFLQAIQSEANMNLPWPSWFAEWAQSENEGP